MPANTIRLHRVLRATPECVYRAFLDAGALPTLHERYGISAERMSASIKAWLA